MPVVLSVGDHRSEGLGDALPRRCDGIDREPQTPISECDKADGLHDGRVVEAVATHRRVHVVKPRIEPVGFPRDDRADATRSDWRPSMVRAVAQAARNRVDALKWRYHAFSAALVRGRSRLQNSLSTKA